MWLGLWFTRKRERGKKEIVECFNIKPRPPSIFLHSVTSRHQYFSSNYANMICFVLYLRASFCRHHVWLFNHEEKQSMRRFPTRVCDLNNYYRNELCIYLKECLERPFFIMKRILDCGSVYLRVPPTEQQYKVDPFLLLSAFSFLISKTSNLAKRYQRFISF